MKLFIKNILCCFSIVMIITCNDSVPKFDQDNAYQFLLDQCDFGPKSADERETRSIDDVVDEAALH